MASLLTAAVSAQAQGWLADQLEAALEHRWLIEQAKGMVRARERLDAQAAFERLWRAARSSSRRLADVAREVTAGKPLPQATRPPPGPSRRRQADQQISQVPTADGSEVRQITDQLLATGNGKAVQDSRQAVPYEAVTAISGSCLILKDRWMGRDVRRLRSRVEGRGGKVP